MTFWRASQILRQAGQCRFGLRERLLPGGQHAIVALRLAAALGRRLPEPGLHEPAPLEPRERCVDGPDRDVAPGMLRQLAPDGHAVRVVTEPDDGEEEEVLESAEMFAAHCYFFVVNIEWPVKREAWISVFGVRVRGSRFEAGYESRAPSPETRS